MGLIAGQRFLIAGMDFNPNPTVLREHRSGNYVLKYAADVAGLGDQGDLLRIQLCTADELLQMCNRTGNDLQFAALNAPLIQQAGTPFNF